MYSHFISFILFLSVGMTALFFGYYTEFIGIPEDIRMWLQAFAILTILLSLVGALKSTNNLLRTTFS